MLHRRKRKSQRHDHHRRETGPVRKYLALLTAVTSVARLLLEVLRVTD